MYSENLNCNLFIDKFQIEYFVSKIYWINAVQ